MSYRCKGDAIRHGPADSRGLCPYCHELADEDHTDQYWWDQRAADAFYDPRQAERIARRYAPR